MGRSRPIAPVDTIWLNMDRPDNLMVIESLVLLGSTPDWDRLLEVLQERLVERYPVFRQRPRPASAPWARPRWADDPDFRLERHVQRATLPAPGDDAALQAYVEQFLHLPLDRDRPCWQMHLVEGYGDGAALFSPVPPRSGRRDRAGPGAARADRPRCGRRHRPGC